MSARDSAVSGPQRSDMTCPKCSSKNCECQIRPHVHRCLDCGYDGTFGSSSTSSARDDFGDNPTVITIGMLYDEVDRLRAESAEWERLYRSEWGDTRTLAQITAWAEMSSDAERSEP